MTRSAPWSPPVPPTASDLNRFLTDALIELRSPRGWLPAAEDLRAAIDELEAALLDRDRFRPVLRHLQSIRDRPPSRNDELTADEEAAVLAGGLTPLYSTSPRRFFEAVSNPLLLLGLRAVLLDDLPGYWWALVRQGGDAPPRTAEDIIRRAAEREPAAAALGGPATGDRWIRTVSADRVVRLQPGGEAPPVVTVEFALEADGSGWLLRAEPLAPVPLSGSRCTAVLLAVTGAEVGRYEGDATGVRFPLEPGAALKDEVFGCEYERGPGDRIRFALAVAGE